MADINVERKGGGIWPWIIGLLVLGLLIWLLAEMFDTDEPEVAEVVDDPVLVEPEPPVAAAPVELIPVALIVQSPATYVDQPLTGEVRVADVPTDRGFWIEDQGQRLFVILNDAPAEQPLDINPGQTLRISDARVFEDVASVSGEIDADTRAIVEGLPVFLGVDEANIEVVDRPM